MEIVGSTELDPVAEVERLKANGYRGVKPGDRLAKYHDPVKGLNWSPDMVKWRKAWMNDPHTIPRLCRKLDELKQEMKDNQAGMGKASNDASREKYYKAIGRTQHSIDIL